MNLHAAIPCFGLAILVAALAPSASVQEAAASVEQDRSHKQRGLSLLDRSQFDRALAELRQAAAFDPADAVVRDGIGVALGELGNLEEALAAFRRAIELDPNLAAPRFHLGLALERSGHPREALVSYQQAIRLRPDFVEARHGLGSVLERIGDFDGAIAQFETVTRAAPGFAEAHYNLGLSHWSRYKNATGPRQSADIQAAIVSLKAAARLAPTDARVHAALGQLLADTEDLAGAVESLRRAQALAPESSAIAYDLGLALRRSGDLDGAESQLRRALVGTGGPSGASRALGLVLRQKDDLTGAANAFAAAVQANPQDALAYQLLGSTLIKLSREDEGLRALDRAIELDPFMAEARVARAQAFARQGRADLARRDQSEAQRIKAAEAAVGRAMILLETGQTQARNGQAADSLTSFRQATVVCPELSEAHFQLGVALIESAGDTAAAELALNRAIELHPSRADAYYQRGRLRERQGDNQGAADAFASAIELKPSLLDAHRALAAMAISRHDWATAIEEFDVVLAWQPDDRAARDERAQAAEAQMRTAVPR